MVALCLANWIWWVAITTFVLLDSIPETVIITSFGFHEVLVTPFGLRNAGQTFQKMRNSIFHDLPFSFVYIDDVLIVNKSPMNIATNLSRMQASSQKMD